MRKKRVQKTYTVVYRYGRKKKVTYRGIIEYIPYPTEEARDDAYESSIKASLKALERKYQKEKRKAGTDPEWKSGWGMGDGWGT